MVYTPPLYPTSIPSEADLRIVFDDLDKYLASDHNSLLKELRSVMGTLGTSPQGTYTTVSDRIAAAFGANTELSNLIATKINTSLLPNVDNAIDVGSSGKRVRQANIVDTRTVDLWQSTYNRYGVYISVGSITPRYYLLGTINDNNGTLHLSGLIGGHTLLGGKAQLDLGFSIRDGFTAIGSVFGLVGTSADIKVYDHVAASQYRVYILIDDWALCNFTINATSGATVSYDGTYTETDPAGTYGAAVFSLGTSAGQLVKGDNAGLITLPNLASTGLTASKPVFSDANKKIVSTGTLGYDQGGTQQTAYAKGDLLYASAANTLAKLPIGANANVLSVNVDVPKWVAPAAAGYFTYVAGGALISHSGNIVVSGLTGNTDHIYKLFIDVSCAEPGAGAIGFKVSFNADVTADNYEWGCFYGYDGGHSTGSNTADTAIRIGGTYNHYPSNMSCEATIYAKSGKYRTVFSNDLAWRSDSPNYWVSEMSSGWWKNSADQITSITINWNGLTVTGVWKLYKITG